jgi:phosphatidylserine decarboxylase
MAIVLVGAMIVAGIRVIWEKKPFVKNRKIQQFEYPSKGQGAVHLKKGDELGRFLLGSTVVICFPKNTIVWNEDVQPNAPLKMGESIAMLIK